ncbi:aldehyde ferredoxin oxidoreductase C-terminal domain-containing protein, partial [Chloroflexota bacterium]
MPMVPLDTIKSEVEGWGISKEAFDRIFTPTSYYGEFNAARLASHVENLHRIFDCLGMCSCWGIYQLAGPTNMAELYSAATGIDMDPLHLNKVGERVHNLYKVLNVREGFNRKDDAFPEIWLQPAKSPDGLQYLTDYYRVHQITRDDLHRLLDDYYDERGWSMAMGIPTEAKLIELGLQEMIADVQ